MLLCVALHSQLPQRCASPVNLAPEMRIPGSLALLCFRFFALLCFGFRSLYYNLQFGFRNLDYKFRLASLDLEAWNTNCNLGYRILGYKLQLGLENGLQVTTWIFETCITTYDGYRILDYNLQLGFRNLDYYTLFITWMSTLQFRSTSETKQTKTN